MSFKIFAGLMVISIICYILDTIKLGKIAHGD